MLVGDQSVENVTDVRRRTEGKSRKQARLANIHIIQL